MKKHINFVAFLIILLTIFSCSTDDKFSGSPTENQTITTLTGSISTDVDFALPGQKINFVARLPEGKVFNDTVTVEITTRRSDGGRVREYFDIMPGESTVSGKVGVAGAVLFEGQFELFMSAIEVQTVDPGIHYLMTSNKVVVNSGNSSIPDPENDRLIVRLTWENSSVFNKFKFYIDKPIGSNDVVQNFGGGSGIQHIIRIEGPGPGRTEGPSQSFREGEYIFKIGGDAQLVTPEDKKYRILVVWPNGDVKIFQGVYNGLTPTSPQLPVLKVIKTGSDATANYTAEAI
jgi:hypothetical protein